MNNHHDESTGSIEPAESLSPGPDTKLATCATWLAFLLGFSPLGADILIVASQFGSPATYAALVGLFFIVMITPVVLLYRRSGFAGFLASPIRMTFTFLIIACYLLVHGIGILKQMV